MRAALIGKPLGHSYSKIIHEFFGYPYDLCEVDECELPELLRSGRYNGFNVTIPYKKAVIPLLDEVDPSALEIGAVNTVNVRNRRLIGYNTDVLGMEYMLKNAGIELRGKKVMVLGTGGTSLTANAVAKRLGAKEIVTVGRSSAVNYDNCYQHKDVSVIINTTPVGMYPNVTGCPIEVERFPALKGVADVIYNPLRTELLQRAKTMGVKTAGGLRMLVSQAVYAAEIFTGESREHLTEEVYRKIRTQACNVAFIGMPASGKSTLARLTAEHYGKTFIDTDLEVERLAGKSIPEIFREDGEAVFRRIEAEAVRRACGEKNAVIATGGGAVLREDNRREISRNSVILHVKRDVEKLSTDGRPLSKSVGALIQMQEQRMPIYCDLADFSVCNDGEIAEAFDKIKEILG